MAKISPYGFAGVLELVDFIKKENIKTLIEYIVAKHIERYANRIWCMPWLLL